MQVESTPGTSLGGKINKTQLGTPPVALRTDEKGKVWVDNLPSRGVGRRSRYMSAVEYLFQGLSGLYETLFKSHQKTLRELETVRAKLRKFEGAQQDTTDAAAAANEIKHLKQQLQDAQNALEETNESHRLANQARDERDEQREAAVKYGVEALKAEHAAELGLIQDFVMETLEQLEEAGALNQELEAQLRQTKGANRIFDETARLSQALVTLILRVFMTIKPVENAYFVPNTDEEQPEVLVIELLDIELRYIQSNPPSLTAYCLEGAEEQFLPQTLELDKDGLPTLSAMLLLEFLTKLTNGEDKQKFSVTLAKDPALYLQLFGTPPSSTAETSNWHQENGTTATANPTANWTHQK